MKKSNEEKPHLRIIDPNKISNNELAFIRDKNCKMLAPFYGQMLHRIHFAFGDLTFISQVTTQRNALILIKTLRNGRADNLEYHG